MMQLKFNLDIHSKIYEFFCFKLVYTWMMLLFYFSVCMHMSFSLCGCKQLDLMGWKVAHRRGNFSFGQRWNVLSPLVTCNRARHTGDPQPLPFQLKSYSVFSYFPQNEKEQIFLLQLKDFEN